MGVVTAEPQKPLFVTVCPKCGGLGFIPDPEPTGWATVCECSDNPGERVYEPELAAIPF